MAEVTVQVPEWLGDIIGWVNTLGEEKVRQMVRDRLAEVKDDYNKSKKSHIDDGFMWNDLLAPNDNDDQWKQGGDCTLCRKSIFCSKQCKANKLLKKIVSPFLIQMYFDEHPEAAVKTGLVGLTPKDIMRMVNLQ